MSSPPTRNSRSLWWNSFCRTSAHQRQAQWLLSPMGSICWRAIMISTARMIRSISRTKSVTLANGIDMLAGNNDFNGTNDSFNFAYEKRLGDFDVKVRVARLDFADTWTVASLMRSDERRVG